MITSLQGGPFTVGETRTLVVTEANTGAAWLTGPITATMTLPTGLTFQSAAGANWSCSADGQTMACTNPDNMAPDAAGLSRNATDAATASPAAGRSLPATGRPEAAIALLAVTFLAVGGFGIARSQRFAKQHASHT